MLRSFGVIYWTALLVLGVMTSRPYAASVEPLYTEISKLSPETRQKRLEEGARREGALTYYSISQTDLIAAYIKGFTTRYPFIRGDFYRGSGNQLVVRTMMEHKSGRLSADVISVGTENVMALKRSGIWTRYRSPEAQNYPREQYDKDGYFHSDSLGLATMAYNSLLVKKEEAPKSYSDLLDLKWKGSVTIDLEPERAMLAWLSVWGEAKTRDFVQKLLANGTTVRRGHTLQGQLLCAGEFKVAVEIYPDAILRMKQDGCPAAIVFPNPTPAHISGAIGVYVNTTRPHAAALFIDFMKSAEGAKILASTGRLSGRKGVKSLYDDLNNLEERGIPLLVVGPEQSELVAKPMERIMKDILVP